MSQPNRAEGEAAARPFCHHFLWTLVNMRSSEYRPEIFLLTRDRQNISYLLRTPTLLTTLTISHRRATNMPAFESQMEAMITKAMAIGYTEKRILDE
jgi:hypothetical protein